MRVRHILPGFGWIPHNLEHSSMSGIVGVAYHLAQQQIEQGYDSELVGLGDPRRNSSAPPSTLRQTEVTTVRPWPMARFGPLDFRYVAPVATRLALRTQADIHHIHTNPYLWWVGRAAHRVLHYNTPVGDVSPAYVKAVNKASAIICCSRFIRDQFAQQVAYPEQRLHVIPNGVDLKRFGLTDREACRQELGIAPDDIVVLFAGQVNHQKGLLHLVRACKALQSEHPLHLLVAGSSTLWRTAAGTHEGLSAYEQQVLNEAQTIKSTFLGKVAKTTMPSVYRAADLFVCPSVWDEPFGMVILEAMASGVPVVATTVGGIPEIAHGSDTIRLVPPGSPDALAHAMRMVLEHPELRATMRDQGLRLVQQYDWSNVTQRIQAVYDAIQPGAFSAQGARVSS